MITLNHAASFQTNPVAASVDYFTVGEVVAEVKSFRPISCSFMEECPLTSLEDQARLITIVADRLTAALGTIEKVVGEDQVPSYFAAVLLAAHGYEPVPIHLRYFNRPRWELHIRHPLELLKLAEAMEFAADALEDDSCLTIDDIHSGIFDGAVPYDAFDQYVNGTEPLDLFPHYAFAMV